MAPVADDDQWLRSSIGSATADSITVGGLDLPTEVMGHLTLTELAYRLIVGRAPTGPERRLFDAVLGRHDGSAVAGHLQQAIVRPTLEVILTEAPTYLKKKLDPEIGIALIAPDL